MAGLLALQLVCPTPLNPNSGSWEIRHDSKPPEAYQWIDHTCNRCSIVTLGEWNVCIRVRGRTAWLFGSFEMAFEVIQLRLVPAGWRSTNRHPAAAK